MDDPDWSAQARPLQKYLRGGPRTWHDLRLWGRANGVKRIRMRQLLAWMEDRQLALGLFARDDKVHWMTPQVLRDNLGCYFLRASPNR